VLLSHEGDGSASASPHGSSLLPVTCAGHVIVPPSEQIAAVVQTAHSPLVVTPELPPVAVEGMETPVEPEGLGEFRVSPGEQQTPRSTAPP